MAEHYLIVSNPPQPPGDLSSVAPLFELAPVEVRMKANYGIPEIWFADEDESTILNAAQGLSSAGLRFTRAVGREFRDIPAQRVARSVAFGSNGLQLADAEDEHTIPYDAPTLAVFCQPKGGGSLDRRQRGSDSLSSVLSHSAAVLGGNSSSSPTASRRSAEEGTASFLDLYTRHNGALSRFAMFEELVGLSTLDLEPQRGSDDMTVFVNACVERFTHAHLDRRLVGMRVRNRMKPGTSQPTQNRRKGFAFAGPAAPHLLRAIAPELEDMHQAELSSRLVYLTVGV